MACMRRICKLSLRILAQNGGRDRDRLQLKLALLRRDRFSFFRGSNPLFLDFLPRSNALFRAPRILICGDLHLENYGTFKGDNRLCYFDLNDFDEACLAPFTIDIVRFLASIGSAAPGLGLTAVQTRALAGRFLQVYTESIADGKPRWIERALAQGLFRSLLRRAMQRTRRDLLARYTKMGRGVRHLRIKGAHALGIDPAERTALQRLMNRMGAAHSEPRFFKLLDAARRIAGNGSLGLPRYALLVRGRGSPDQNFVLDLKLAAQSAVAAWLLEPQPSWPDEASRIVAVQRIVQAIPPAMLRAVDLSGRPFVLKELQPSTDRFDFDQWRDRPRRVTQAIEGMARVAAWAHLRGCGHYGAATAEALQAYVAETPWRLAAERIAASAVRRMQRAWAIYSRDYDGGAVEAAVRAWPGGT